MKKKIPAFKNARAAAAFVDKADLSQYDLSGAHYLHIVVSSQRLVRPEVMAAYRRSNEKHRALYKRLAGGK